MSVASSSPPTDKRRDRRVLAGSLADSSIEWYDFFLYATASALIFNHQFFPTEDPFVSQMLSYVLRRPNRRHRLLPLR